MRDDAVRMIADERAALLGMLGRVEGEAWSAPTACTGWSVKDVLAHMVEGELEAGRVCRGEVRTLGPPDTEAGVAKWRALPGVAVRSAYWQHGTATQRVLDAMTPDVWRAAIDALGCRRVSQLVRLHLFGMCVHGHDLADALSLEPVWGARLPFLADYAVRAAPPTLTRRGVPPAGTLALSSGGRTWTVSGSDGGWHVAPGPLAADATITLEPDDLVLATTGRMPVVEALARASVTGDATVAETVLEGWQIFGA